MHFTPPRSPADLMTMLEHAPGKTLPELSFAHRATRATTWATADGGRGEDGHGYPPDSAKVLARCRAGRAVPEIASVTGAVSP